MIEADVLRYATLLIAADAKRHAPVNRRASMVEAVRQPSRLVTQDVLQAPRDPVRVALDGVSDHTLVYIMALMLYGQADDSARQMVISFHDAQAAARERFQSSGRARIVRYVQSRPLSRYLLAGIARMQRDSAQELKPALRSKAGPPQKAQPAADSKSGDHDGDQDD